MNPVPTSLLADDIATFSEEGRKEIVYLTTHSTHFIYGYMASEFSEEGIYLYKFWNIIFFDIQYLTKYGFELE